MERIDDPSNEPTQPSVLATVSPGFFRRPSALLGNQGTIVTADWLNNVQEELYSVATLNSVAPDKANNGQLIAGILYLAGLVSSTDVGAHAALISSESVLGHLEVATQGEVANLTNNARAMTPHNLTDAFPTGLGTGSVAGITSIAADADHYSRWIQLPTSSGNRFTLQYGISRRINQNHTGTNATAFALDWVDLDDVVFLQANWDDETGFPFGYMRGFANFGVNLDQLAVDEFEHSLSNVTYRCHWAAIGVCAQQ